MVLARPLPSACYQVINGLEESSVPCIADLSAFSTSFNECQRRVSSIELTGQGDDNAGLNTGSSHQGTHSCVVRTMAVREDVGLEKLQPYD